VADKTAGPINDNQADFLTLAKRNVDRLHRLINDTLDFAKLDRGEFGLQCASHDLNSVVNDVVAQQRLAAEKQGLAIKFDADPSLPPVWLDYDRISQVLTNLIGNAIRYCPQGSIDVSTRRDGSEALVHVRDTGPGIPADKRERIFDAFVQLSTGPGRRPGGTGLGLTICKKLVELHGGRIWIASEIGKGSTFSFALDLNAGPQRQKESERGPKDHSHR
jgi:signal transduction histidine kinase